MQIAIATAYLYMVVHLEMMAQFENLAPEMLQVPSSITSD